MTIEKPEGFREIKKLCEKQGWNIQGSGESRIVTRTIEFRGRRYTGEELVEIPTWNLQETGGERCAVVSWDSQGRFSMVSRFWRTPEEKISVSAQFIYGPRDAACLSTAWTTADPNFVANENFCGLRNPGKRVRLAINILSTEPRLGR